MGISRRTLLRAAGAFACSTAQFGRAALAQAADSLFVGARQEPDGHYTAACIDWDGLDQRVVPLPGRGHGVAPLPGGGFVVFARRPGRFALAVCPGSPTTTFAPPDDRHFYGHGCLSPAGDLLYVTENDFARGRGVIGVYSPPDWRRVGEFPTHGIEPHEIVLMTDGETVAVANGGIATDPAIGDGRTAIGSGIASDLVLLDRRTGALKGQWRLPADLADLSIRHLAIDGAGSVWFGCQWEGPAEATPPLLGRLAAGGGLRTVVTAGLPGNLANYVGSVAADQSGSLIAASAPRAGAVVLVDAAKGCILGTLPLVDGCGLAADNEPGRFLASSGTGALAGLGIGDAGPLQAPVRTTSARWDNHLRRLDA